MARYNIEIFKNTDFLIISTLTEIFMYKHNNLLYLKHKTFCKYLTPEEVDTICNWFYRYQQSLYASEDPIDFVKYICSLRNTSEYMSIRQRIDDIWKTLLHNCKLNQSASIDLVYFVKCYYREDKEKIFSCFGDKIFNVLSQPYNTLGELLYDSSIKCILPKLQDISELSYEVIDNFIKSYYKGYTDIIFRCSSILLCLMVFITIQTYNEQPLKINWSFIINQINKGSYLFDKEAFDICYLDV